MKRIGFMLLIIIILLTSCGGKKPREISIAEQYGLAYAPLQIMKARGMLEKRMENVEVNWKRLGNTAAIREAMLAQEVDIGFMALPPFLIGRDRGMDWKIISGISMSPLGLITNRPGLKRLHDITEDDRIALPQPGSIQHILLAMAAERQTGRADKYDELLVTMAHPDGMNALLSRTEITLHFTSPPYIFQELEEEGIHQVISGEEAMGEEFTFIIGVATGDFLGEKRELCMEFMAALREALEFISRNPEDAAAILANEYNLDQERVLDYINRPGMKYTEEVKGVEKFIVFMRENGYLEGEGDRLEVEDLLEVENDGASE